MSFFDRLRNDIIGEPFELETFDLEEAITNSSNLVSLCNNINRALLEQEIYNLDLNDRQKDRLRETIYLNCLDSQYDTNLRDQFLEENKLNEEDK